MAKKASSAKQPVFEESLKSLEKIVGKLESGNLGLAESLDQYEQGIGHLKDCYQLLDRAERRIELVSGIDPAGEALTEPFQEGQAESRAEKRTARSRASQRTARNEVDDETSLF